MQRIYFDNNASTSLDSRVHEAMQPYFEEHFGNPSSGHRFGEAAAHALQESRSKVASLLQCSPSRITFTSGGTESNNQAIWSAVASQPGKKHIISSRVEHASVLKPLLFLQERFGYQIELLPVDSNGALDLNSLEQAIRPDTTLVSLMGANNETGVIWPVSEIGALCKKAGVLFHCDTIQMAGKEELNCADLGVDYICLSSHKLHGPKGVGALYSSRQAPVTPLIMGADQERGNRAGTENISGIVGFAKACELAVKGSSVSRQQMAMLRDRLQGSIETIPDVLVNGGSQPRLANTLNVSIKGCASEALIQELDERGIAVSAHSACQSGDLDPSHVLSAMQVPEEYLHGSLRISLSRMNTAEEVESLVDLLPRVVRKLRVISV